MASYILLVFDNEERSPTNKDGTEMEITFLVILQ